MYKCIKCAAEVDEMPRGSIRCPTCAGKILIKLRSPVTKEVSAL